MMRLSRLTAPSTRLAAGALLLALGLGLAGCAQKPPEEKLDEALALLQEGKIARGVLQLKELVEKNGDDPAARDAHLALGNYYFSEGSFARAVEHFDAVLAALPITDERAIVALDGKLGSLLAEEKGADALAVVESVLEDLPSDDVELVFAVQRKKADVLLATNTEESIAAGHELLVSLMREMEAPYRHVAREHLANYYRQFAVDFEKSNTVYEAYIEAHPDDPLRSRLEMAMGVNLRLADKREEGLVLFEPAAAKLQEEADAAKEDQETRNQLLTELAQNQRMMGLFDEAEATMRTLMAENVRSMIAIQMQFAIAEMTVRDRGDLDRGLELLAQISRENPGSSIAETADRFSEAVLQAKAQMEAAQAAAEGAAPAEGEAPAPDAPAPDAAPAPEAEATPAGDGG